jgi:hypothetical protein
MAMKFCPLIWMVFQEGNWDGFEGTPRGSMEKYFQRLAVLSLSRAGR